MALQENVHKENECSPTLVHFFKVSLEITGNDISSYFWLVGQMHVTNTSTQGGWEGGLSCS